MTKLPKSDLWPGALFADIFSIFSDPILHWPALGAGILLSVILFLGYSTMLAVRRLH